MKQFREITVRRSQTLTSEKNTTKQEKKKEINPRNTLFHFPSPRLKPSPSIVREESAFPISRGNQFRPRFQSGNHQRLQLQGAPLGNAKFRRSRRFQFVRRSIFHQARGGGRLTFGDGGINSTMESTRAYPVPGRGRNILH